MLPVYLCPPVSETVCLSLSSRLPLWFLLVSVILSLSALSLYIPLYIFFYVSLPLFLTSTTVTPGCAIHHPARAVPSPPQHYCVQTEPGNVHQVRPAVLLMTR